MADLLYCVRLNWGSDAHYGPEAHPFCEVVVVTAGGLRVILQGREIAAQAGDILVYPAEALHEEWRGEGPRVESIVVAFNWPDRPKDGPCHLRDRGGRVETLLGWLAASCSSWGPFTETYGGEILRMLAMEYCRLIQEPEGGIVERTRAVIMGRLAEDISLDELSQHVEMSKYHFGRRYRQICGLTPMQDVQRLRLETARQLLLATNAPLKEIADRVGICDRFRLSRLLRAKYGAGARQLRAQTRK